MPLTRLHLLPQVKPRMGGGLQGSALTSRVNWVNRSTALQANREQTVRSHPVLHLPGDTRLVPERLWRVEAWRRRQIRYQGHLGEVVPVIFPGPPTRAEPGRRSTGWKEAMNSLPVHLQDSETPAFSSQVNRPSLGRDEGQAQHQAHWELRETPSSPRDPPPPAPPPTTAHTRDSLQGLCGQCSLGSQGPLVRLPSLTLQATRGGSGRVPCPGSELTSGRPSPQRWGLSAQTPFFSVHPLP